MMRTLRAPVLPRWTGCGAPARLVWATTPRVPATRSFVTTIPRCSQPLTRNSKLFDDADAAVSDVQSGSTLLSSGFGLCGVAGKFSPLLPVGELDERIGVQS